MTKILADVKVDRGEKKEWQGNKRVAGTHCSIFKERVLCRVKMTSRSKWTIQLGRGMGEKQILILISFCIWFEQLCVKVFWFWFCCLADVVERVEIMQAQMCDLCTDSQCFSSSVFCTHTKSCSSSSSMSLLTAFPSSSSSSSSSSTDLLPNTVDEGWGSRLNEKWQQ